VLVLRPTGAARSVIGDRFCGLVVGFLRVSEHNYSMTQRSATPQLTSREYKDGRGWYVEATTDGGVSENVGDFSSDFEAKDWILRKSMAYFKARQK
jgi:hypothetical protein